MKTNNNLYLLAVGAAALALNISTGSGQVFSPADAVNNRAIAASPRAKEAFPWLTRAPSPASETCCERTTAKNALNDARKHRSFAASPRALEQFPELALPVTPCHEPGVAPVVVQDTATLTSPRAREASAPFSRGATMSTATCSLCRLTASVK